MIHEEELLKLKTFGREKDGSFSDRWKFSIISTDKTNDVWTLFLFSEVDGSLTYLKRLDDMDDLKNICNDLRLN